MARDKVEARLEHVKALRAAGPSDAAVQELRKALADAVNVIVAKAATVADEWQARTLVPDLVMAFDRLLLKGADGDPQCWGKNAVSKSLKNLGFSESAIFLRGLQHQQWEGTWGGKSDTAGVLRGTCALALVQCVDLPRDETLRFLIDASTEMESRVRADAARALEQMGGRDAILLLRLKARSGDTEVRVTGQVLESVLHLERAAGIPFVTRFLQGASEDVREEAALALGTSRLPEAVEVLKDAWTSAKGRDAGSVLFRALSASRQDAALEFLLDQVLKARPHVAEEALRALELHRDSAEIVKRIELAVESREDLRVIFDKQFRS